MGKEETDDIESIGRPLQKLIDGLKKCNYPKYAATYALAEIASSTSDSYYEDLGLLVEALLLHREAFFDAMKEEREKEPDTREKA